MQPVLVCNKSGRISNNKTLKKASYSHIVQGTKQIKQKKFLDFMLEKNQGKRNLPKN